MTGESKIVSWLYLFCWLYDIIDLIFLTSNAPMQIHKDPKSPFLMSGCKVADGAGTMLVRFSF